MKGVEAELISVCSGHSASVVLVWEFDNSLVLVYADLSYFSS